MPALFVFLLKVNIALLIFCLGYYLVLRKLTFYTLNRVYLVLGIISSSVYPLINFNDFVQRHQELAAPVQKVALNWQLPATQFAAQPAYWNWVVMLFWLGVTVFAARLAMQLLSLYKLYHNSAPGNIQGHEVRITAADVSPFSFLQNIYINPDKIETKDLKSILQHEQVHVKQWHTLDILLAEMSVIFYWFNPGVWFMKKAVRENIEFITDRSILQKGMDSKAYQYSLLNVSVAATASAGITNHFNFSTLKKRIKMMNAKRSSNLNLTRYAFLVPAVLICLFVFSVSKAEIVKKTKVAYKSVAASVQGFVTATPMPAESLPGTATDTTKRVRQVDSIYLFSDPGAGKAYTLQKRKHNDSTVYYLDGKVVTRREFKKFQADNPEEITIDDAAENTNDGNATNADDKKAVTLKVKGKFVTVNQYGTRPVLVSATPMAYSARPAGYGVQSAVTAALIDTAKTNVVYTVRTDNDSDSKIAAKGYKKLTRTNYTYTITSDNDTNAKTVAKTYKTFSTAPRSFTFTAVATNPKPWKNYYADGVILIDEKQSTMKDLKKLSPLDIQSITPVDADSYNGKLDEYVAKYGDKAKSGIVYIVTKKNK